MRRRWYVSCMDTGTCKSANCTQYQVSSPTSAPLVTDQTGKLFILLFGCHQQTTVEHGEHTQQLRLYEVNLHSRSCDCHMTSM